MNKTLISALVVILALLAAFGRRAVSSHLITLKQEALCSDDYFSPGEE